MTGERSLTRPERTLVEQLLSLASTLDLNADLDEAVVQPMNDGAMGSLRFAPFTERKMGRQLAEVVFSDSDGIPVSVTLNVDDAGALLELDVFKADFSPLISLPSGAPSNDN